uniref:Putative salivary kunitz domain protein n=1 Tax=Ixodes ricinus TaxID=34613 RepID=A0A0K8RF01_IXORI
MKAILAATCIFSAVVLISALPKNVCEGPHAVTSCDPSVTPGYSYYFNNGTGRCESEFGCGGPLNFPSEDECRKQCPYGEFRVCLQLCTVLCNFVTRQRLP